MFAMVSITIKSSPSPQRATCTSRIPLFPPVICLTSLSCPCRRSSAHSAGGAAVANGEAPLLSEEDAKRKSEALFAEYASTLDKAEALTCVREINCPGFMPQLVEIGLTAMMNSMKEKVRLLSSMGVGHQRRCNTLFVDRGVVQPSLLASCSLWPM